MEGRHLLSGFSKQDTGAGMGGDRRDKVLSLLHVGVHEARSAPQIGHWPRHGSPERGTLEITSRFEGGGGVTLSTQLNRIVGYY